MADRLVHHWPNRQGESPQHHHGERWSHRIGSALAHQSLGQTGDPRLARSSLLPYQMEQRRVLPSAVTCPEWLASHFQSRHSKPKQYHHGCVSLDLDAQRRSKPRHVPLPDPNPLRQGVWQEPHWPELTKH
ncbi:Uncharacterised protein [Vibrio cholerae]|nr:Uncharacterised protein [Vibrio cholerae]CSA43004.1 Uncharacterised protein [Vibrio cholerae]CSB49075.1 Uncharacterised protein [Vibrio cholerae]